MRFDLAVGFRLLNRYEEAYRYLREMLAKGGLPDPLLGPNDPGLNLFKADGEYQGILAEKNRQIEAKRVRILEIEKSLSHGSKLICKTTACVGSICGGAK